MNERIAKIDQLVQQIRNASDPDLQSAALELVETIMDFHASGINRMMEIAFDAGDAGWKIIDAFGRDELVTHVLLLHGLHPVALEDRVQQALENVRPYLRSHGGNVELIDIAAGAVRLRLTGSCNGCASSALTLKSAIEKSINDIAPDVTSIACEGESNGQSSTVAV